MRTYVMRGITDAGATPLRSVPVLGRRATAALSLALVLLPLMAVVASAHTRARCLLTRHNARCMGTIANHTVSPAPAFGRMTLTNDSGRLDLVVRPVTSATAAPMRIKANLFCTTQAGEPTCVALTQVGRTKVLITTVGNPGGSPDAQARRA
jgi:hypothetical protein